jgi:hypothetical protein
MQRNGTVRRRERHPVEIEAVMHRGDGTKVPVKLTNFSDQGCRIESTDEELRVGERLAIAIPRMGQVKAQVRWVLQDSAGARFVAESDF